MDKPARYKAKNPKTAAAKPKNTKKRKSEGPTCSMFLAELTRKLAHKKKQEEESPKNIVHKIIESITNALPMKFIRKSPTKKESPIKMETLTNLAPELLPNDTLDVASVVINADDICMVDSESPPDTIQKGGSKMPRMPLISSEVFKVAAEKRKRVSTEEVAVNTSGDHDVAVEIAKHVGTLKKISLIAEEFNQKTAKNLKEIVDSVQEDLIKKLEEIQAEQKINNAIQITERKEPLEEVKI